MTETEAKTQEYIRQALLVFGPMDSKHDEALAAMTIEAEAKRASQACLCRVFVERVRALLCWRKR